MISIAINVLWFLVGLIVLCGIVYLAIWVIEKFVYPIPEKVKQGVWVIVLLLALIALLGVIAGGGSFRFPSVRGALGEPGGAITAIPAGTAADLPRMLAAASV
jgi:hypothetical protein